MENGSHVPALRDSQQRDQRAAVEMLERARSLASVRPATRRRGSPGDGGPS
jgi:hypothetical protein